MYAGLALVQSMRHRILTRETYRRLLRGREDPVIPETR